MFEVRKAYGSGSRLAQDFPQCRRGSGGSGAGERRVADGLEGFEQRRSIPVIRPFILSLAVHRPPNTNINAAGGAVQRLVMTSYFPRSSDTPIRPIQRR